MWLPFVGGIYRNVSLWVTDPLSVWMLDNAGPGVYLRQRRVSATSATVDVTTKVWNNGTSARSVAIHGVNRHQDYLDRGWAIGDAEHTRDFDLMDEMGVNALRTAHYQQDQEVYNLADERGYLVWLEIPLVNSITDSAAFRSSAAQQLREMIRQNYNHPSIVFWGIGNEQHADDGATNELLDTLAAEVTAEDADRFSTYAHD